jgi:hypothetical protein
LEKKNLDANAERLGRLKPEEKIAIAVDMVDACLQICADDIRAQNPGISEEELIEIKRREDVRAILRFTALDKAAIEKQAKKDGTLGICKNSSES